MSFFLQAEDGIRDLVRSRGLGDVYKRQGLGRGDRQQRRPRGVGLDEVEGPVGCGLERFQRHDRAVRRGAEDDRIRVDSSDAVGNEQEGGRLALRAGLDDEVLGVELGQRGQDVVGILGRRRDEDVAGPDTFLEPVEGLRDERAGVAQRLELLGLLLRADRPQPGATAPGEDDGIPMGGSAHARYSFAATHSMTPCRRHRSTHPRAHPGQPHDPRQATRALSLIHI